jgi:hypothetical protein
LTSLSNTSKLDSKSRTVFLKKRVIAVVTSEEVMKKEEGF